MNRRNEGRYFDGFDASCRVAENFIVGQGDAAELLMAQTGAQTSERAASLTPCRGERLRRVLELDKAQGMVAR